MADCAVICLAEALCLSFELRPQGQNQPGFKCNLRSATSSVGTAPATGDFGLYNRHNGCTYRPTAAPSPSPTSQPASSAPTTAAPTPPPTTGRPTRVPTTGRPTTSGPSTAPSSSPPAEATEGDDKESFVGSAAFIATLAVAVLLIVFAAGSQLGRSKEPDIITAQYGIGGALPLRVAGAPRGTSGRGGQSHYASPQSLANTAYGPSAYSADSGGYMGVGGDGWSQDGSPAGAAGYMPHSPRDPTSGLTHDPLVDELFANVRPVYVGLGAFGGQDTMSINTSPAGSHRSKYSGAD